MSNRSEHVKRWRKKVKNTMIESMGGSCCICKYKKCNDALELHHLDPALKDFSFGKVISNPKAWHKIVIEIRKCILVCSNCHREIHNGITKIPDNSAKFNEDYVDHDNYYRTEKTPCPVCGKMKPSLQITCSRKCASKRTGQVDWNNISVDIEKLRQEGHSFDEIGGLVGTSGIAVSKRLKRIIKVRNGQNINHSKQDPKPINV